jgi:hypothetical protein
VVVDAVLLRRASTVSFAMGFYMLVIQIVAFFWVLLVPGDYLFEGLTVSVLIASLWLVSCLLSAFVAFYLFRVGLSYRFLSLKITGLMFLVLLFAELAPSVLIKPYPPWLIYSGIGPLVTPEIMQAISYFSWLLICSAVALALLFIWGATDMMDETGLKTFETARTIIVLGLFSILVFPIGIIVFGSGLQKLATPR